MSSELKLDSEIDQLREKLNELKKQRDLQMLKDEIAQITVEAANTPNEFEGSMQVPDTSKVLQTKRKFKNLSELIISRFIKMLSPRPVIGNLIAIALAIFGLVMIQTELFLNHFGSYQHYFGIGLLVVAGIQVIKSSTRSLIVPLVVSISGAIISHTLTKGQTLFTYDASFYQWVMIAGVIGIAMSVVTID